ncbi:glycosyltransferase family 4 protein [[Eubacterium] cellulosolvens]
MRKLHVWLVVSGDISWGSGGIVGFTLALARYLIARGVDVNILYRRLITSAVTKGLQNSDSRKKSMTGHLDGEFRFPYLASHAGVLLFSLLACMRLTKEHKAHGISVIHSQDLLHGGLAAIAAGSLLHIPVVATSHGKADQALRVIMAKHKSRIGRFYSRLCELIDVLSERLVMKYSDVVVAVSQDTKRHLVSLGVKPEKVVVLRAGIEVEKFREVRLNRAKARRMLGIQEKRFVIGYVGRISPTKNLETLVEAVANVVNVHKIHDILLVLVGRSEASQKARLLGLAQSRGIERNILSVGFKRNVYQLLRALDVVALVSPHEGSPRSIMEAMASARVVLASDIPSIRELVTPGEDGVLVNPHDLKQIEDAIVRLYRDDGLRKTLGARAAAAADDYDQKITFRTLANIYGNLASNSHKVY